MAGFKVRRAWLTSYRPPSGWYTKAQLVALGIGFPPPKGWVSMIDGNIITLDQKKGFEEAKTTFTSNGIKIHLKKSFDFVCENADKLSEHQKNKLREIMKRTPS